MDHHHHHHHAEGWPYHYAYDADYIEDPDYIANDTRHQLPLLSSIGRGPRGAGIKIKVNKGADGSYKLDFVNDLTNETLATTPNLDPGYFTITSTAHNSVDGETRIMHVTWVHGAERKSWDIPIPAGAHGSRLYLSAKEFTWKSDLTYQTTVDDLIHYGKNNWPSKPIPRPNDIVCFVYKGGKEYRTLAFGTIEAVEKGQVVFTSRTSINIPIPSIGKNGHWYVDGVDTGVNAQGPKGDKGDTGPQGKTGAQGPKGSTGKAGAQGPKGDDGKDAQIEIGTVTTLAPTMPASVSAERDPKTNVTTLNFGIPEGAAGKAINIRGGIWKPEFLPPFDETPINDAFIVYDGDKQFDLYVRGEYPVQAELGGPWTVVENWQGRPGSSVRYMLAPKILLSEIGEEIEISTAEAASVFAYYDYLADDDLVIDSNGTVGIISSAEDNSGTYVITTVGKITLSPNWEDIVDKYIFGTNNNPTKPGIVPGWNAFGTAPEDSYMNGYGNWTLINPIRELASGNLVNQKPGMYILTSSNWNDYQNIPSPTPYYPPSSFTLIVPKDNKTPTLVGYAAYNRGPQPAVLVYMSNGWVNITDPARASYIRSGSSFTGFLPDATHKLVLKNVETGAYYFSGIEESYYGSSGHPGLVPENPSENRGNQVLFGNGEWKEIDTPEVDLVSTENNGIVPKSPNSRRFFGSRSQGDPDWLTIKDMVATSTPVLSIGQTESYLLTFNEAGDLIKTPLSTSIFGAAPYGTGNPGLVPPNKDNANKANQALFGDGTWKEIEAPEVDLVSTENDGIVPKLPENNSKKILTSNGTWSSLFDVVDKYTSSDYIQAPFVLQMGANLTAVPFNNFVYTGSVAGFVPSNSNKNKANQALFGDGSWKEIPETNIDIATQEDIDAAYNESIKPKLSKVVSY